HEPVAVVLNVNNDGIKKALEVLKK
ncbi:MAG: hypothetical protein RIR31_665, partial [Bacteroidota bacterium]